MTASSVNNPASNNFDGDDVEATLTAFTITPSGCPIVYICQGVTRLDGTPSEIGCSDFMGNIEDPSTLSDNIPATFSISADTNDYLNKSPITPGVYVIDFEARDLTTQTLSASV